MSIFVCWNYADASPNEIPFVFVLAVTARKGKSTENALWVKGWGQKWLAPGQCFTANSRLGKLFSITAEAAIADAR
jgi:hypothetical protein